MRVALRRHESARRPDTRTGHRKGTDGPSPGADQEAARQTLRSARGAKLAAIAAAPESEVVKARAPYSRQNSETPFLVVIKTLEERRHGIGVALDRRAAGCQRIGTALSALHRIGRPFGARADCAVAARCSKIAIGLFECGPRCFLLRCQPQSGMKRSDPRIEEGGAIFRSELRPPREVFSGRRLLCKRGRSRDEHECGGAGCDCLKHGDLLAREPKCAIETAPCRRKQVTFELNVHYREAI